MSITEPAAAATTSGARQPTLREFWTYVAQLVVFAFCVASGAHATHGTWLWWAWWAFVIAWQGTTWVLIIRWVRAWVRSRRASR